MEATDPVERQREPPAVTLPEETETASMRCAMRASNCLSLVLLLGVLIVSCCALPRQNVDKPTEQPGPFKSQFDAKINALRSERSELQSECNHIEQVRATVGGHMVCWDDTYAIMCDPINEYCMIFVHRSIKKVQKNNLDLHDTQQTECSEYNSLECITQMSPMVIEKRLLPFYNMLYADLLCSQYLEAPIKKIEEAQERIHDIDQKLRDLEHCRNIEKSGRYIPIECEIIDYL